MVVTMKNAICGLSTPFVMLSGVPQGSGLGAFGFNNIYIIFTNNNCDISNLSDCLFSDYVIGYQAINSPSDCVCLQSDVDCVHKGVQQIL
jgi:uncharacterized membrane protein